MAKALGLLIIALLALIVGVLGTFEFMTRFGPQPSTKVTNRTFVVEEAKMTEKVIYAEQGAHTTVTGEEVKFRAPIFGTPIFPSTRRVNVFGICEAGIDFQARPADIEYNSDRTQVTIRVEKPSLMGCKVEAGDIELSDTGGIIPASSDLSNELIDAAMPKLENYALKKGLLEKATQAAIDKLDHLARQFGFTDVRIDFVEPED